MTTTGTHYQLHINHGPQSVVRLCLRVFRWYSLNYRKPNAAASTIDGYCQGAGPANDLTLIALVNSIDVSVHLIGQHQQPINKISHPA